MDLGLNFGLNFGLNKDQLELVTTAECIFRDIRASTLTPPNLDSCLELVGRAEFDLDTPLNRDGENGDVLGDIP